MPTKNTSTIESSTSAVRLLFVRVLLPVILGAVASSYFTTGGVSKVWNGGGDGTVHSSPPSSASK